MRDQHTRRDPVPIHRAFVDLNTRVSEFDPPVSIVTPFYNMQDFIKETAESVFRQTFRDFEWLVIDDGSTDPKALKAVHDLAERDGRVRILHQMNAGPGAARNHGFREARGEYVAQLDADDLMEPTFLEKCLWFLETHPHCAWAHTASIGFGDQEYLWLREFDREELLKENFLVPTSVVRRNAHFTVGGYDESIRYGHEDWDYWLSMVEHGFTSKVIPEFLCWYRRRSNSRISETDGDPFRKREFAELMRHKHGRIYKSGLPPTPEPPWPPPYPLINDHLPFANRHPSDKRVGVLFMWPWLTMGGSDKFNLDLLRGLDRSEFRPYIVTTLKSENPWGDRFSELTPEIFHLPNFVPVEDWLRFLVYLLRSREIQIIFISNSEYGYLCSPVLKRLFPQVKVIDFVHLEEMYWKGGGYAYGSMAASPVLARSLVSSQRLRETYVAGFSRDPGKLHCVYTNIDAEKEFNPERFPMGVLRRQARCPLSVPVILFMGRICDQKRPEVIVEIASRLRRRTSDPFQLWIVGDGPDLPKIKQLTYGLGLEDIAVFWGSTRDPGQYYREADIFLLPSKWEGIALTLYEAMAMSLPVVASDVGGQGELVTPEVGFLLPAGNPDDIDGFVETLLYLIENPIVRRELGAAGRERVRTYFRLSKMLETISQHLIDVVREQEDNSEDLCFWPLALDRYSQWLEMQRLEPVSHRVWQEKLYHEKRASELEDHIARLTGIVSRPNTISPELRERVVVSLAVEQIVGKMYRSKAWKAISRRRRLKRMLLDFLGLKGPEERIPIP
jgi:glycosyltransferase involved in cell wall biosynthesis